MKYENIKINNNKPTIFLDMDGTLYLFKDGSFENSILKEKVIENALLFIQKTLEVTVAESENMLKKINKLYGSDISIGIEELYKIPRNVYFETVWNIDAKGIVDRDENIKVLIIELKKTFNVFLVSDAPKIWVSNALKEMKLYSIMKDSVICGDGKYMKSLNTQFDYILDTYRLEPSRCISIGDQEESDIIPAKKLGMKTILISGTKSEYADFTVSSMREIAEIIDLNYADMRKIKTTNSKKHHTDPSS